jgi:hypothetical protein
MSVSSWTVVWKADDGAMRMMRDEAFEADVWKASTPGDRRRNSALDP